MFLHIPYIIGKQVALGGDLNEDVPIAPAVVMNVLRVFQPILLRILGQVLLEGVGAEGLLQIVLIQYITSLTFRSEPTQLGRSSSSSINSSSNNSIFFLLSVYIII